MNLRGLPIVLLLLAHTGIAAAQTQLPTETKNAALRYWMAFAEMKDPPADKPLQELLEKVLSGGADWDEARLGPLLDMNANAIAIFRRGTKLPECDWGVEYSLGPEASIAYVPKARVMASLNTLQGVREMARGNNQAAMDAWLAGIRFSQHLAQGGSLIFALVAKTTLLPNLQILTTANSKRQLDALQSKQVEETVKALPIDAFDWGKAWGFEEASLEQMFLGLQRAADPAALYESLTGKRPTTKCIPPGPQELQLFRNYMNQVEASLKKDPAKTSIELANLRDKRALLCTDVRNVIPLAEKTNEARAEIAAARSGLLQTFEKKAAR